eukprot:9446784-Alexandrium_andersonii.AAC.1
MLVLCTRTLRNPVAGVELTQEPVAPLASMFGSGLSSSVIKESKGAARELASGPPQATTGTGPYITPPEAGPSRGQGGELP